MLKRHATNIIASIGYACINFVIQFGLWLLVINYLGWEKCGIGIGLGGAIYPALFAAPLIIGSFLFSLFVLNVNRVKKISDRSLRIVFVALSSLCILLACPMDSDQSFVERLFECVF